MSLIQWVRNLIPTIVGFEFLEALAVYTILVLTVFLVFTLIVSTVMAVFKRY